jgi:hypothetical protein
MAYTTPNTSSLQSLLFDTELPMGNPEAARYKARTTVERTNSELKDGYLPDKIYRRGCHARYDIELAILLTTLKKARNVLLARGEARVGKSA